MGQDLMTGEITVVTNNSADGLFLYDFALGAWIWTRASDYPLIYAFPPQDDWLLYLPWGLPSNRWFYSYERTGRKPTEPSL